MNIDEIKQKGLDFLNEWQSERTSMLEKAEATNPTESFDITKSLFGVADQLTETVRTSINIPHPLIPDIVSIISAVVLGITNGNIVGEVNSFLSIRNDVLFKHSQKH